MIFDLDDLIENGDWRLLDIIWIGGSPCSGKTSIAKRLIDRFGMTGYSCDDAYYRHLELISPSAQPVWHRLAQASCDELWMRSVPQQVAEELTVYREEFPFILHDLGNLDEGPVVAEGAALLPESLAKLDIARDMAIWIVPTEDFQRREYAKREWRHEILKDCTEPQAAWDNWMARDAGFARIVTGQAHELGYTVITVDGRCSLDSIYREVARTLDCDITKGRRRAYLDPFG